MKKLFKILFVLFLTSQVFTINCNISQRDALCEDILINASELAKNIDLANLGNKIVQNPVHTIDDIFNLINQTQLVDEDKKNLSLTFDKTTHDSLNFLFDSIFEILFVSNSTIQQEEKITKLIEALYNYNSGEIYPFRATVIKALLLSSQITISRLQGYEGPTYTNKQITKLIGNIKKEINLIYKSEKTNLKNHPYINKKRIKKLYKKLECDLCEKIPSRLNPVNWSPSGILVCSGVICIAAITAATIIISLKINNTNTQVSNLVETVSTLVGDETNNGTLAGLVKNSENIPSQIIEVSKQISGLIGTTDQEGSIAKLIYDLRELPTQAWDEIKGLIKDINNIIGPVSESFDDGSTIAQVIHNIRSITRYIIEYILPQSLATIEQTQLRVAHPIRSSKTIKPTFAEEPSISPPKTSSSTQTEKVKHVRKDSTFMSTISFGLIGSTTKYRNQEEDIN